MVSVVVVEPPAIVDLCGFRVRRKVTPGDFTSTFGISLRACGPGEMQVWGVLTCCLP